MNGVTMGIVYVVKSYCYKSVFIKFHSSVVGFFRITLLFSMVFFIPMTSRCIALIM